MASRSRRIEPRSGIAYSDDTVLALLEESDVILAATMIPKIPHIMNPRKSLHKSVEGMVLVILLKVYFAL
ncbi:unnamed protein product [Parnassius apollo]|uniref:(apollo) hypothetical protein n=1 Tax=Parnassius apollo TaxID=110799 RepID=A0A8S3YBA1_PARAO|nr:unnamed protein product [Parnassius apollo]